MSVVAHTHWDREWYHVAARFRQRLVALIDALLANAAGDSVPFLLDGQAIVLEDYLAVRPQRAREVSELLARGALEAGPWYVLGDGLIPSAEAMVRNLLTGRRVLRQLAPALQCPPVAYCPDTFGHAAALPEIAGGFGFPLAIVWRGYGGIGTPAGDTARWQSESGAEVLLYHLPPDGYETGSSLPLDETALKTRWLTLRETLHARSNAGVVLLPNGADHHALQPNLAATLRVLERVALPDVILRESLRGFADRLLREARTRQEELPVVTGELRNSYGYTWTLGGTLATRAAQKRANAGAERTLLRDVEPWLVLAWLHALTRAPEPVSDASLGLEQAPALLDAAWRTLLRAHPHDTLCGCSIDAVARSMNEAIASTRAQARGLRAAALDLALRRDDVAARARPIGVLSQVVLRNRCARWRGGVAEVVLDETLADVPVGPSSAHCVLDGSRDTAPVSSAIDALTTLTRPEVSAPMVDGCVLQLLGSRVVYRRRESPQHYPDNDLVRAHRVLVWVPPVAPLGLAVQAVTFLPAEATVGAIGSESLIGSRRSRGSESLNRDTTGKTSMFKPVIALHTEQHSVMGNGRLQVVASLDGVSLQCGTRTLSRAITFETTRDVGDSYTPAIRGHCEVLRIQRVEPGESGPLRASVHLFFGTVGKKRGVKLRATLMLDAASDTLRVDIRGTNRRRDHRLRVRFNTDVLAVSASANIGEFTSADAPLSASQTEIRTDVWADAAFGPVARQPLDIPADDQMNEMVPATMPMHRWATLSQSDRGATLHADGLAEGEANRQTGGISLTLLRAIGELSRNNLPERPGHAGWPAPIPLAQSQGQFRARIAVQLHGGWSQQTRDEIEDASDAFLLPLTGGTMRDLLHTQHSLVGPQLEGRGLRLSACLLADDGDGIVLRCVNDSAQSRIGAWTLPQPDDMEYAMARLDETVLGSWNHTTGPIAFTAPPRAVVTVRVRRRVR